MPAYTVKVDKQSCLSSARCLDAFPDAFEFDEDHLAQPSVGAAKLRREQALEAARACPGLAISVLDEDGNEIEP